MSLSEIVDAIESHLDDAAAAQDAELFERVCEVTRHLAHVADRRMSATSSRIVGEVAEAMAAERTAESHMETARTWAAGKAEDN